MKDNFFCQAVQRGDREQLVGPEVLHRFIACNVAFRVMSFDIPARSSWADNLALPGTTEERFIAHKIEFYMRNLYFNIGVRGEERSEELKVISAVFLWLAASDEARTVIFAPELTRAPSTASSIGNYKRPLKIETWNKMQQLLSSQVVVDSKAASEKICPHELLRALVSPPYAQDPKLQRASYDPMSPYFDMSSMDIIEQQFSLIDNAQQQRWGWAFAYAIKIREIYDGNDSEILANVFLHYPDASSLPHRFARFVQGEMIRLKPINSSVANMQTRC